MVYFAPPKSVKHFEFECKILVCLIENINYEYHIGDLFEILRFYLGFWIYFGFRCTTVIPNDLPIEP